MGQIEGSMDNGAKGKGTYQWTMDGATFTGCQGNEQRRETYVFKFESSDLCARADRGKLNNESSPECCGFLSHLLASCVLTILSDRDINSP